MPSLLIVGAKGFAKELVEAVLQQDETRDLVFFDDVSSDVGSEIFGRYLVLKSNDAVIDHFKKSGKAFAIGVGDPRLRRELTERFLDLGGDPETVVSPFAKIGRFDNRIGDGVCVLTDAIIENANQIGHGVLLHVGSLVTHDVTIGDFCEISPKAILLGGVTIGNNCRIGTNATILPRIRIGDDVVIGAGAVVTKDVEDGQTVVGVPARLLEGK